MPLSAQRRAQLDELRRLTLETLQQRLDQLREKHAGLFAGLEIPNIACTAQQAQIALHLLGLMTPEEMQQYDETGKWRDEMVHRKAKIERLEARVEELERARQQDQLMV